MSDRLSLDAAYDGPIPAAELAAARFGADAFLRLARATEAAMQESRAAIVRVALAQLRSAMGQSILPTHQEHVRRLASALLHYRRAAILSLA